MGGCKRTGYGRDHGASEDSGIKDFRERFLRVTYHGLKPHLEEVNRGNFKVLLPEPPSAWVMTRGSTGPPKVIPATKPLEQVFTCGARALLNYALKKRDSKILAGGVLNLNFPSVVGTLIVAGKGLPTDTVLEPMQG